MGQAEPAGLAQHRFSWPISVPGKPNTRESPSTRNTAETVLQDVTVSASVTRQVYALPEKPGAGSAEHRRKDDRSSSHALPAGGELGRPLKGGKQAMVLLCHGGALVRGPPVLGAGAARDTAPSPQTSEPQLAASPCPGLAAHPPEPPQTSPSLPRLSPPSPSLLPPRPEAHPAPPPSPLLRPAAQGGVAGGGLGPRNRTETSQIPPREETASSSPAAQVIDCGAAEAEDPNH